MAKAGEVEALLGKAAKWPGNSGSAAVAFTARWERRRLSIGPHSHPRTLLSVLLKQRTGPHVIRRMLPLCGPAASL